MSPPRIAVRVVHPCLTSLPDAVPLAQAHLTDRVRLAVILQGAGLLSLLERAGWQLSAGWEAAGITMDNRLAVPAAGAGPGRSSRGAQELLRDLLERLFDPAGGIAGRGEARRAARALAMVWQQSLVPLPPEEAVAQILDEARFLWGPPFAAARRALAGEIHLPERRLWVAGRPPFRRYVLALASRGTDPGDLLAGPEARQLWEREEDGDPRELAAAGRWRAAVAAWERHHPTSEAERVERARALAALGRFESAIESLAGAHSAAAGIVRVRCQLALGQLGGARLVLRGLEKARLSPQQTVELADAAVRLLANSGEQAWLKSWVERALAAGRKGQGATRLYARLVAAAAAWDRGRLWAMDRCLNASRGALEVPELAWRWHHAQALRAMRAGDGPAVVESAARAIRASRRFLARHEAAGLWNDLGIGRTHAGDLPGAERSFLHAVRLFGGCDGPRRTTLALHNLAEVRLRRGRLAGVRQILERSAAENRLAGNLRGLTQDSELWARFELVQGRAAAALVLCREAQAELGRQELDWRRAEIKVLAARALGWLGRTAEAAAELEQTSAEARAEQLEPEERPALQAHAGDLAAAVREAEGTPFAGVWRALAAGGPVPAPAWEALDGLEPYRSARLVFDIEALAPGAVPADRLRPAIAVFRAMGAVPLAERLEAREEGPWRALAAYFARDPADPEALAALFAATGYPETGLTWVPEGRLEEAQVLLAGAGGSCEVSAAAGEGRLTLRVARTDSILRALFALALRDVAASRGGLGHAFDPLAADPPERTPGAPAAALAAAGEGGARDRGTIVGDSPALLAALDRAARFAPSDLSVLILGESGTGKELIARRIHRASARVRAPMVTVNCAALSETLLLSDLFGHVKGAFTGAERDRAGVFETAQGGTVFLDEIGDLPAVAQGMLLRVLQDGEVRRVGESLSRRIDVRILAATHRDLDHMGEEGTFRRDLYFRLKGGIVEMPPLRARGEDVLRLADHVLDRLRMPRVPRLSREARAHLLAYPWPGNVRELQNVLSVAAALADGGVIRPVDLDLPIALEAPPVTPYHQSVEAYRRQLVENALVASGGNQTEAARLLGLSRQSIPYLVRQLGLQAKIDHLSGDRKPPKARR